MLWIDLRNAIEDGNTTNFTCMLLRLMMKSDPTNMKLLGSVYPEEAQIVWLFKNWCTYKDDNKSEVDYELLEIRACSMVKNNNGFKEYALPEMRNV